MTAGYAGPSADADALRTAVAVLRARTSKPKSFLLRVVCSCLEKCADRIEDRAAAEAERERADQVRGTPYQ